MIRALSTRLSRTGYTLDHIVKYERLTTTHRTNTPRVNICLFSVYFFSVTVNTPQTSNPRRAQIYSTHNTICTKAYPYRSPSILPRRELTVTKDILTPTSHSGMMNTDDTATYPARYNKTFISQIDLNYMPKWAMTNMHMRSSHLDVITFARPSHSCQRHHNISSESPGTID